MLSEITWRQFYEWMTFSELEPFDAERDDERIASVVQAILNVNRNPKKHGPIDLRSCRLYFGDSVRTPEKTTDWKRMRDIAKRMTEMSRTRKTPVRTGSRRRTSDVR